jgi:mono/diheme cytochrome c family protein
MKAIHTGSRARRGIVLLSIGLILFPLWTVLPGGAELDAIIQGHKLFGTYCSDCHADGTGKRGPDLTNREWIYGGWYSELYASIARGRPGGMPPMLGTLGKHGITRIISYIRSIECDRC